MLYWGPVKGQLKRFFKSHEYGLGKFDIQLMRWVQSLQFQLKGIILFEISQNISKYLKNISQYLKNVKQLFLKIYLWAKLDFFRKNARVLCPSLYLCMGGQAVKGSLKNIGKGFKIIKNF